MLFFSLASKSNAYGLVGLSIDDLF